MILRNCSLSIADQVDRLRELGHGWYDGIGTQYSNAFLDRAAATLTKIAEMAEWMPYLYPTVEGSVRAEFDCSDAWVVLEMWPVNDRISLEIEGVDDFYDIEAECAADEIRRFAYAN